MRFVFVLAAALTVCAQAAPQFDNSNPREWRTQNNRPQDRNQWDNENRHRRPNDYDQQMEGNNRRSSNWCRNRVIQTHRDQPNNQPSSQYSSQSYDDYFPAQTHYDTSMYSYNHRGDRRGGRQFPPGSLPPQHHGRHGPLPPPYHGRHGPPPPPRPYDRHGPPPPPRPHDGHGPPPPRGHHDRNRPPPPPHHHHHHHHHHDHPNEPRPMRPQPPYSPQNGNEHESEICEDTSNENLPKHVETTTIDSSGVVEIPGSSSTTSTPAKLPGSEETVTQSTVHSSVSTTTKFDWNNYFLPASADNPGGVHLIDIRMGRQTEV